MMHVTQLLIKWFTYPCTRCHEHIARIHQLEHDLENLTTMYNDLIDDYNTLDDEFTKFRETVDEFYVLNDESFILLDE